MANLKTIATDELAKKLMTKIDGKAQEDAAVRAELESRGAIKDNQFVQGWQSIAAPQQQTTPAVQPITNTQTTAAPLPNVSLDTQRSMLDQYFQREQDRIKGQTAQRASEIPKEFLGQKTAASVEGQIGRSRLAEQMSNLGVLRGGQGEKRLELANLAEQGRLGQIQSAEIKAQEDLRRGEESALFGLGSQRLQSLMEIQAQEDELRRRQAEMLEQRQYEEGLAAQKLARSETDLARQMELDTIGQYSGDYQAEINRRLATPDTSDDWIIPYLKAERVGKIAGMEAQTAQQQAAQQQATIDAQNQAYKRAFDKWKAGAPLTDQEMTVLGVTTRTKPVTGGSGVGGLSPSSLATNARYKITNGLPLTPQEAQIMGLPAGYISPEVSTTKPFSQSTAEQGIANLQNSVPLTNIAGEKLTGQDLDNAVRQRKVIAADTIISLLDAGKIDDATAESLIFKNNLSDQEVDQAINRYTTPIMSQPLDRSGLPGR